MTQELTRGPECGQLSPPSGQGPPLMVEVVGAAVSAGNEVLLPPQESRTPSLPLLMPWHCALSGWSSWLPPDLCRHPAESGPSSKVQGVQLSPSLAFRLLQAQDSPLLLCRARGVFTPTPAAFTQQHSWTHCHQPCPEGNVNCLNLKTAASRKHTS